MEEGRRELGPQVDLELPESLRAQLAEPFGTVHTSIPEDTDDNVIAVGDATTQNLVAAGITPRLAIIDGHTQRGQGDADARDLAHHFDHIHHVANPAGQVTAAAWRVIVDALNSSGRHLVIVEGEEDLLAIPVFLNTPLGTKLLYGMPSRGVVLTRTDEALRDRVHQLVAQFRRLR